MKRYTQPLAGSRRSRAMLRRCTVVFCVAHCWLKPCSTWKKKKKQQKKKTVCSQNHSFFPLPHPSKGLRAVCFLDSEHAKLREPRYAERIAFKEKSVESQLADVRLEFLFLTCCAFFWLAQTAVWTATSCARTRWRSSARRTPGWPAPSTVQRRASRLSPPALQRVGLITSDEHTHSFIPHTVTTNRTLLHKFPQTHTLT